MQNPITRSREGGGRCSYCDVKCVDTFRLKGIGFLEITDGDCFYQGEMMRCNNYNFKAKINNYICWYLYTKFSIKYLELFILKKNHKNKIFRKKQKNVKSYLKHLGLFKHNHSHLSNRAISVDQRL